MKNNNRVNKSFYLVIMILLLTTISFGQETVQSLEASPVIGQEVIGKNLQQLEYQTIVNSNAKLKEQNFSSSNLEIIGDTLKRQRQKITIIQSDSIELEAEVVEGKKKGFFSNLFGL